MTESPAVSGHAEHAEDAGCEGARAEDAEHAEHAESEQPAVSAEDAEDAVGAGALAEDAGSEGTRTEDAESESPAVSGLGSVLNKERSSSSSLESVSGLSLVPSAELSTALGVSSQFLSPSANTVVSSPLIEISSSEDPSIGSEIPRHLKLRTTTSRFSRLNCSHASPTHCDIITLILLAADCQCFLCRPLVDRESGDDCFSARSTASSIVCLRISLKGRLTDTSRG